MSDFKFNCHNCGVELTIEGVTDAYTVKCPQCLFETYIPETGIFQGMKINSYTLEELIKTGEMGELWLASHDKSGKKAAIKILPKAMAADEKTRKRFEREAKNTSKLNHPNIVKWLDYGETDGKYYIITAYFDRAMTLRDYLAEEGEIPEEKTIEIIMKVVGALRYAWENFSLIHRNIKPANILVDPKLSTVQLMDFGLSKMLEEDATLTMAGTLMGSSGYISTEMIKRRFDIDCRADIYSLGIVMFKMLSGRLPFDGENAQEIMESQEQGRIHKIREFAEVSDGCVDILERMTAPSRNNRYSSWEPLEIDFNILVRKTNSIEEDHPRKKTGKHEVAELKKKTGKHKIAPKKNKAAKSNIPQSLVTDRKSPFPWTPIIIFIIILALTAGLGFFLFNKYKEYQRQKDLEEKAKLAAKQKREAEYAAEEAKREKEFKERRQKALKETYDNAVKYLEKNAAKAKTDKRVEAYLKQTQNVLKGTEYEKSFEKKLKELTADKKQ
jgi:serine/threonine-protein kinase